MYLKGILIEMSWRYVKKLISSAKTAYPTANFYQNFNLR